MGYAFISYSSKDQPVADSVRELFKKKGITTWMAPYDIPVGSKYALVISKALKECACLVLLLTNASQSSTWVSKEVERAISYNKVIIPIQLESLVLNDEFEFYISTDQIIAINIIDENSSELQKILTSVTACTGTETGFSGTVSENPAPGKGEAKQENVDESDSWELYKMGYACEFGVDMPINYEKAVEYYLKSAQLENSWAQNRLGDCYAKGHGVAKDLVAAAKWYSAGAKNGDHTAQHNLGMCYLNGSGVEKNPQLALTYFCKAAEQGNGWAQYTAGFCYEFGKGTPIDYAKAFQWYTKAAEQGNDWAQHRLGECYYYGRGVPRDFHQAFHWLNMAAQANNSGVYKLLAECYRSGRGVEKDIAMANYWQNKK